MVDNPEFCSTNAASTEVAASEPATLPNGLKVRVASAKSGPADADTYDSNPKDDTLVTVTTEITNGGSEPFEFPGEKTLVVDNLLYGPDRAEAQGWAPQEGGAADLPRRLAPGSSATMVSTFTLPAAGLADLAFEFGPSDAVKPVTFTGLHSLLLK